MNYKIDSFLQPLQYNWMANIWTTFCPFWCSWCDHTIRIRKCIRLTYSKISANWPTLRCTYLSELKPKLELFQLSLHKMFQTLVGVHSNTTQNRTICRNFMIFWKLYIIADYCQLIFIVVVDEHFYIFGWHIT